MQTHPAAPSVQPPSPDVFQLGNQLKNAIYGSADWCAIMSQIQALARADDADAKELEDRFFTAN